jgi:small-conductance mechanosensitive channel
MKMSIGLATLGALLALSLTFPANASGIVPQDVIFIQTTSGYMECEAGSSVVYQWFIFNGQANSQLVEIEMNVSSGDGWQATLNRAVTVLRPQESTFVNLTFTTDNSVGGHNISQAVIFDFTDLNNSVLTHSTSAAIYTKTIPLWGVISPGKNKLLGAFDNPLPPPLDSNYATFGLSVALWALIAVFFAYVINPFVRMFTKRTKTDIDDRILKIMHMPIFALIIIYGFVSSLAILPLSEGSFRFVSQIYGVFLIAIVTFLTYKIFKEVLVYVGKRIASRTKTEIDDVLIPVIDKVGGLVVVVFGSIAVLSYLGYNITFLLAGVGVMGLVIAFAAQEALSNFFSSMTLLLDRPFTEGDYIQLSSGETCRVDSIGVRSSRLYDVFQNTHIILPNNKLVNDKVTNLSEPDGQGVAEVAVSVAAGTDVQKVERILLEAASAHKEVLKDAGKEPASRLAGFRDSSLDFKLFIWVEDFMTRWRVAHELRKEIYRRFIEEGIEMAMPIRAVTIKEKDGKG